MFLNSITTVGSDDSDDNLKIDIPSKGMTVRQRRRSSHGKEPTHSRAFEASRRLSGSDNPVSPVEKQDLSKLAPIFDAEVQREKLKKSVLKRSIKGPTRLRRFDSADWALRRGHHRVNNKSTSSSSSSSRENRNRRGSSLRRPKFKEVSKSEVARRQLLTRPDLQRFDSADFFSKRKHTTSKLNDGDMPSAPHSSYPEPSSGTSGLRRSVAKQRIARRALKHPDHLRRFDSADFFSQRALKELADALEDDETDDIDLNFSDDEEDQNEDVVPPQRLPVRPPVPSSSSSSSNAARRIRKSVGSRRSSVKMSLRRSLGRQATERKMRAAALPGRVAVARRQLRGRADLQRFDSADFFSQKELQELDNASRSVDNNSEY